ncbi:hypothetical protein PF006_g31530, partial [Phytophthora fragariae]
MATSQEDAGDLPAALSPVPTVHALRESFPTTKGVAITPRVRFTEIKSIQPLSKRSPRAKIVKEYLGVAGGHTQ